MITSSERQVAELAERGLIGLDAGMTGDMEIEIRNNEDRRRYELSADGQVVSIADYHVDGPRVVFPHTVTTPAMRGQGFAERLVAAALDDVRASGRTVVPACWFVASFIDEHPEYADLIAA